MCLHNHLKGFNRSSSVACAWKLYIICSLYLSVYENCCNHNWNQRMLCRRYCFQEGIIVHKIPSLYCIPRKHYLVIWKEVHGVSCEVAFIKFRESVYFIDSEKNIWTSCNNILLGFFLFCSLEYNWFRFFNKDFRCLICFCLFSKKYLQFHFLQDNLLLRGRTPI